MPTSYAAFISYYRLEAGSDARFLQGALAAAFRQPVFLDATDADELRAILTDGRKFVKGPDYTEKFSVCFGEGLVTSIDQKHARARFLVLAHSDAGAVLRPAP